MIIQTISTISFCGNNSKVVETEEETIEDDYIEIFDKSMPIRIIMDWEVSIRPCEFKNFNKIIHNDLVDVFF